MQLSSDILFSIMGFPVTNTVMATLLTDVVVIVLAMLASKAVTLRPGNLQNVAEAVIDYFKDTAENIAGEKASFICPWVVSF